MEHGGHVSRRVAGCLVDRWACRIAVIAAVLLPVVPAAGQPGGLFTAVGPAPPASAVRSVSPAPADALTLRRRLVTIDLGQLAPPGDAARPGGAAGTPSAPPGVLTLNLFADAVFTGLIDQAAPTFSGGWSLSGRLAGIELGTMTLVVNGAVVAGTVRTPEATFRLGPAGRAGPTAIPEETVLPEGDPADAPGAASAERGGGAIRFLGVAEAPQSVEQVAILSDRPG